MALELQRIMVNEMKVRMREIDEPNIELMKLRTQLSLHTPVTRGGTLPYNVNCPSWYIRVF